MLILISKKSNIFYYVKNIEQDYHCKEGFITKNLLQDKNLQEVKSNVGINFLKFESNFYDECKKIKRGPQIITHKDLGYILARTGIGSKSTILEAGGGSGHLTLFFSNICKLVVTYEIQKNNFDLIQKNLDKANVENVKLIEGDLFENVENEKKEYDLLFLDMPSSYDIFNYNLDNLVKKGSYICFYIPSIFQIHELIIKMKDLPFFYLEEISEIILRKWRVKDKISHPENRKEIDHTAFLVFVRVI